MCCVFRVRHTATRALLEISHTLGSCGQSVSSSMSVLRVSQQKEGLAIVFRHVEQDQDQPVPSAPPNGGFKAWLQVLGAFCIFLNTWWVITSQDCQINQVSTHIDQGDHEQLRCFPSLLSKPASQRSHCFSDFMDWIYAGFVALRHQCPFRTTV